VVELVAIWLLSRGVIAMADARRRDRGWVAAMVVAWALAELFAWSIGRRLGLSIAPAYVVAMIVGAGAGLAIVAWLRSLPPLPAFDPRIYDQTWSEGTCPQCGSEQTYVSPTKIRCFSCDYVGKPAQGRFKRTR
jgi:hypothetical protein